MIIIYSCSASPFSHNNFQTRRLQSNPNVFEDVGNKEYYTVAADFLLPRSYTGGN